MRHVAALKLKALSGWSLNCDWQAVGGATAMIDSQHWAVVGRVNPGLVALVDSWTIAKQRKYNALIRQEQSLWTIFFWNFIVL